MRLMAAVTGGAVLLLAAVGFVSVFSASPATAAYRGIPDFDEAGSTGGEDTFYNGDPLVEWTDHGKTFAVVLWGSGSCPVLATSLDVVSADKVTVTFDGPDDGLCTLDSSAFTHEFDVPNGANDLPLTVSVVRPAGPGAQLVESFLLPE